MTSLYHLRSGKVGVYRITKLDEDYSVESTYLVSATTCDCPAGPRPTCRHRQMLPFFLAKPHIDDGWMLDWATRQWRKPLCEDGRVSPLEGDTLAPISEMQAAWEAGNGPFHYVSEAELINRLVTIDDASPMPDHAWGEAYQNKEGDHGSPPPSLSAQGSPASQPAPEAPRPSPAESLGASAIKRRKL